MTLEVMTEVTKSQSVWTIAGAYIVEKHNRELCNAVDATVLCIINWLTIST